jgi:cell wall-associated NlpC family hydrolase
LRFLIAAGVLITSLSAAATAVAGTTGGVAPMSPPATTNATAPAITTPALHLDPVTARSSNIAYSGPVYERTAAGEVVPYSPTAAAPTAATGVAASTGGSAAAGGSTPLAKTIPANALTGPTPRPQLLVPGTTARYVNGLAAAPLGVPLPVQEIIWAGNELIGLPYIYGGGHASFVSQGYDCSGTVSFALHGAGLLTTPEDSSEFMVSNSHGVGRYVAIFSNPGHAYMTVAGLRLDTSAADDPTNQQGPRWRPLRRANSGYVVRHPLGL